MKNCSNPNCKQINPQSLENFYKSKDRKDGLHGRCKPCVIEARRIYRESNPEKVKETKKKSYIKHRDGIIEKVNQYYEENKESVLEYKKVYYEENKEDIIEYKRAHQRKRTKTDPLFKLRRNLRRRISLAFVGLSKSKNTLDLLGCSIELALEHLESQFYNCPITNESMNWNNYGKLWEIDHIKPLGAVFSKEEIEALCYYTNLQPLWKEDHRKKTTEDLKKIKANKNNNLDETNAI